MCKGLLLLTILVAFLVTFLAGPAALAVSRPGDVLVAPARDPATLSGNKGAFGGPPGLRSYVTFESGPVRPLALSADGQFLYAANTPDNRLEIFAVHALGLTWLRSVPVGLEPVAVAVAPAGDEVWVVNHLSDSVSVVDIAADVPHHDDGSGKHLRRNPTIGSDRENMVAERYLTVNLALDREVLTATQLALDDHGLADVDDFTAERATRRPDGLRGPGRRGIR